MGHGSSVLRAGTPGLQSGEDVSLNYPGKPDG